jgi:hypothetical protein
MMNTVIIVIANAVRRNPFNLVIARYYKKIQTSKNDGGKMILATFADSTASGSSSINA